MRTHSLYRYEELASFITSLVHNGTLPPGHISKQRAVSLTTALQAYRLLEDQGVLEARPQSGFYVAQRGPGSPATASAEGRQFNGAPSLPLPTASTSLGHATPVAISGLVLQLLEYAADPRLVPLGCAIPSAAILAAARLDRFLARAARVQGHDANSYTVPKGDLRLRQEIARRAVRWGQALAPEDIVVTCGCTEALTLALKAVTQPGDAVAIESPTYFGILQILEALNLRALELPTDATTGIELSALHDALTRHAITACLLSSSFNNPLGCTMPDAKKRAVLDLLAHYGVPLIEDDIYGDISFGTERPKPFMALEPCGDILYCSSFSKTVAPGYRIGWMVPGRHMQRVLERKFAFTLCGPALPQRALADFLASGGYDHHLRRIRSAFAGNIDQMLRTVERVFPPGTRVSRPAGGFVLWLELPPPLQSRELFAAALAQGICFAPGDVFSARCPFRKSCASRGRSCACPTAGNHNGCPYWTTGGVFMKQTSSNRYTGCLRLSGGHRWQPRIANGLKTLGEIAGAALARQ